MNKNLSIRIFIFQQAEKDPTTKEEYLRDLARDICILINKIGLESNWTKSNFEKREAERIFKFYMDLKKKQLKKYVA